MPYGLHMHFQCFFDVSKLTVPHYLVHRQWKWSLSVEEKVVILPLILPPSLLNVFEVPLIGLNSKMSGIRISPLQWQTALWMFTFRQLSPSSWWWEVVTNSECRAPVPLSLYTTASFTVDSQALNYVVRLVCWLCTFIPVVHSITVWLTFNYGMSVMVEIVSPAYTS